MTKQEWNDGVGRNRIDEQIAAHQAKLAHWNARKNEVFVATGWMFGDNWELPGGVEFSRIFPTVAEGQTFAATLPKSLKARATSISDGHCSNLQGYVWFRATLKTDGVNGGANETGIRRLRAAVKALTFEWNPDTYANSMTEDFFRNLLK